MSSLDADLSPHRCKALSLASPGFPHSSCQVSPAFSHAGSEGGCWSPTFSSSCCPTVPAHLHTQPPPQICEPVVSVPLLPLSLLNPLQSGFGLGPALERFWFKPLWPSRLFGLVVLSQSSFSLGFQQFSWLWDTGSPGSPPTSPADRLAP